MREQEEMIIYSKEIVRILRKAEIEGYDMRELELALQQEDCVDPFDWLKTQYKFIITSVKEQAIVELRMQENNTTVSDSEAKEAVLECGGDIYLAVHMIVCNREKIVGNLLESVNTSREHVIEVLQRNDYDRNMTEFILTVELCHMFASKFWPNEDMLGLGPVEGETLTPCQILENKLRDKKLDFDWRVRMVLCEYQTRIPTWGRAVEVVKVLDEEVADITIDEIVEAVRQCGDRHNALQFLQQECSMCYCNYPASKILSLTACQCKVCNSCMKEYFEVQIKEKHVKNLCCPQCQVPDLDNVHIDEYLIYLSNFLKNLVSQDVYNLFEDKIRDWHLQQDPNFRWCSTENCENGFIFNLEGRRYKMRCNKCGDYTCFKCKKPWEDQHEGLTCEQFQIWKEQNSPEFQQRGLAKHLQENGIDCPRCKWRYTLAKGGCMHFTCTQCGHDFCCGCNQPFMQGKACKLLRGCSKAGLHCHHPRDCLYYLRDLDVAQLQQLLQDKEVEFITENTKQNENCEVMEQKETQAGLKDEPCDKLVLENEAGLCTLHYKEYLVSNINKHNIDPVNIMDLNELLIQYRRREMDIPDRQAAETETQYKDRIINEVQNTFPLEKHEVIAF